MTRSEQRSGSATLPNDAGPGNGEPAGSAHPPSAPSEESAESRLTAEKRERYVQCKSKIKEGLLQAAQALEEVRNDRLYREEYPSFEEFARSEYGLGKAQAYRTISGAKIVRELSSSGGFEYLPQKESHTRELLKLRKPEERAKAWREACDKHGAAVTAVEISAIVETIRGKEGKPKGPMERNPDPSTTSADRTDAAKGDRDHGMAVAAPAATSSSSGQDYIDPSARFGLLARMDSLLPDGGLRNDLARLLNGIIDGLNRLSAQDPSEERTNAIAVFIEKVLREVPAKSDSWNHGSVQK
jgi:hypothetical protein